MRRARAKNEIDFRYSDALTAADDAITFRSVVQTIAARSGLWADFSPKPLSGQPGSGLHINLSVHGPAGTDPMPQVLAGILEHAYDLTAFCNPCRDSYRRLGSSKAPAISPGSSENRSQLIRLPAAQGEYRRLELRSPDPTANPYLAFALLIRAGLDGIARDLPLPPSADLNLYEAPDEVLASFRRCPPLWRRHSPPQQTARLSAAISPLPFSTHTRKPDLHLRSQVWKEGIHGISGTYIQCPAGIRGREVFQNADRAAASHPFLAGQSRPQHRRGPPGPC